MTSATGWHSFDHPTWPDVNGDVGQNPMYIRPGVVSPFYVPPPYYTPRPARSRYTPPAAKAATSKLSARRRARRNLIVRLAKRDTQGVIQCVYCQVVFDHQTITLDHVVPRAHGGRNTFGNYVLACVRCNSKHGDSLKRKAEALTHFDIPILRTRTAAIS